VTMTWLAQSGDVAGRDVQGDEQLGRAVTHVVMRLTLGDPIYIGKVGAARSNAWIWDSSSTQSTIAFLGRVQVEPDDVGDLGHQFRIGGELERLHPPGLHAVLTPHSGHRPVPDPQVRHQKS
jgi:hypothetical protein